MTGGGFEEIPHTADVALRVWGPDFASLLREAALGMNTLMAEGELRGPFPIRKKLAIEAFDRESLLVEWLSALALFTEREAVFYCDFHFESVTDTTLSVVARGVRAPIRSVVKAVTYHNLEIKADDAGMTATVTFDV